MNNNLSSQISRYGVSESFIALIDGMRETPGLTERKYRQEDVNKVAQYLVCRNYGKACLELSYLCWATIHHSAGNKNKSPLIDFFWLKESITPTRFRSAFAQSDNDPNMSIELNQNVLQLTFKNEAFAISPTRVGALAVLLEFIVNIAPQGFDLLGEIETELRKGTDKVIKALSSNLQKTIYQYLSEHLIPAQQQRRLRYITQWLDSQNIQIPFLNDDTLLNFWQQASVDESSPGFKLYSSVFHEFIEAEQALKQAEASLKGQHAITIGFDVDNGDFSPDHIESMLFTQCTEIKYYNWLCDSPKFLTKAQWAIIEPLHLFRPYIKLLTLSFKRLFVFGQWQSVIVQAKRQSAEMVSKKLNEIPSNGYSFYYQQLIEQKNNISNVILALLYIFHTHQDTRYLGCLLQSVDKSTSNNIKFAIREQLNGAKGQEAGSRELDAKSLINELNDITLEFPEVQKILQSAKSAFKANNKVGFKQLPSAILLDDYQEGAEALQHCQQTINELICQISNNDQCSGLSTKKFGSDVSIFKEVFEQIYGGIHA